ncbi:hypothetical protein SKAU_G00275220 [Synaphobranchus kaupii]|uniref:Uncharacterized protein n=1 Tax=Synaphobranchus kaupii TaxID=118154 RepID=A0A9Q1F137_SYNKA|nr:hypothetical protein SKAU_G00275220 [Synaphobranchus kaupii]
MEVDHRLQAHVLALFTPVTLTGETATSGAAEPNALGVNGSGRESAGGGGGIAGLVSAQIAISRSTSPDPQGSVAGANQKAGLSSQLLPLSGEMTRLRGGTPAPTEIWAG